MNPHVAGTHISGRKPDAFVKTKAHAVEGKEENFITQSAGCGKELIYQSDRENVGNPYSLGWFDLF